MEYDDVVDVTTTYLGHESPLDLNKLFQYIQIVIHGDGS